LQLVLLGDSGVGKSCIVLRFVRGQFDPSSKVTVGASFLSQTIALQDSTTVKFEIWDTAGQERYASLAPLYYRGASAAIVVYDITSNDSFQKAQYWVKELQKHGSPNIVMALVGNKADLHDSREVLQEVSKDYADNNGMFFIETSAKTADNVNELFESGRVLQVCTIRWSYGIASFTRKNSTQSVLGERTPYGVSVVRLAGDNKVPSIGASGKIRTIVIR
ncbi:hypothetical protein O6H91_Y484600, partial [Diphasiastrum complanatum]